jgi:hypothetical protein
MGVRRGGAIPLVAGVVAVLAAGTARGATPDLPKTLTVLGQKLELKEAQTAPSGEMLAEYVPAGETLDNWTRMFAVRVYPGKVTAEQAAALKSQEIAARRAHGDYLANGTAFAKGDARVVDFLLSEGPIVEHDIIKYAPSGGGRLASYQLARRYYKGREKDAEKDHDGLTAFIGAIKTGRNEWVAEVDRVSTGLLK